jgi:hypothetical protein
MRFETAEPNGTAVSADCIGERFYLRAGNRKDGKGWLLKKVENRESEAYLDHGRVDAASGFGFAPFAFHFTMPLSVAFESHSQVFRTMVVQDPRGFKAVRVHSRMPGEADPESKSWIELDPARQYVVTRRFLMQRHPTSKAYGDYGLLTTVDYSGELDGVPLIRRMHVIAARPEDLLLTTGKGQVYELIKAERNSGSRDQFEPDSFGMTPPESGGDHLSWVLWVAGGGAILIALVIGAFRAARRFRQDGPTRDSSP